jgi:hypothetical protein
MSLLMMSFKTFTLNLLSFGWIKEYRTGCNIQYLWKKIKIFSRFWQKVTVFEIKCKKSVHITAAVCIFEEWNDHSGYSPLPNFRESDGTYTTP